MYNDKVFSLNNNKLSKSDYSKNDFYDIYYDIDFLKKVFNHCDYDYINVVKATCKIKMSDYINEM